jgi:molecular chaperone DnaK (HSP70)
VRDGNEPAIGFDFGTSTTLIARGHDLIWIGGDLDRWLPSLIGYDDDGSVLIGEEARYARPGQVIRSIKRAITDRRSRVRVDSGSEAGVWSGLRDMTADDLMYLIMRRAERRAFAAGVELADREDIYLGCPAMWDGDQRRRLLDIAHRVGLLVSTANLVDEPIAAGIAWLAQHPVARPRGILVFDMGGGTLDVAVLQVREADIAVLASAGIARAGDALDDAIADTLEQDLIAAGVAFERSHLTRELLVDAARRAKIALTDEEQHPVVLARDQFGPNETWYTRDRLAAVFAPQMDEAEACVAAVLRAASVAADGIDVVVLAGGMSRVPYVQQRLRARFPGARHEFATPSPEDAIALGLALSPRYRLTNRNQAPFDILLEWDEGRQCRVLYQAYTPIVEPHQIVAGGDLRYLTDTRLFGLPDDGDGRLRLVSRSAWPVPASMDGVVLDGFPVALCGAAFEFALYPGGRLLMVDGAGVHSGQIVG